MPLRTFLTHGRAKAGRTARRYIQQLCEDTGCCPEDLPEAMNDKFNFSVYKQKKNGYIFDFWFHYLVFRVDEKVPSICQK